MKWYKFYDDGTARGIDMKQADLWDIFLLLGKYFREKSEFYGFRHLSDSFSAFFPP